MAPKCPVCGKELHRIHVTSYGTLLLQEDGYLLRYEESEYRCPHCSSKIYTVLVDGKEEEIWRLIVSEE